MMSKIEFKKYNSGFTIIEMIVSLGVFSVVMTIAVGSLLVLISSNQKLQNQQSIMTNISFALDSMTREIRTGYFYVCAGVNDLNTGVAGLTPAVFPPPKIFDSSRDEHETLGKSTKDCVTGRDGNKFQGISFYEGGNSLVSSGDKRILYYYDSEEHTILRRVGDNLPQPIISSGLIVVDADFLVTGSQPEQVSGNVMQPTVTIYLIAIAEEDFAAYNNDTTSVKTYQLETTITQRILDL